MKLKGIPRTASVAWSPNVNWPGIATGTMAGALDESFSNTTELELFQLDWTQKGTGSELQASGVVSSNARFNRLAWTSATGEFELGLIAGGMENGELDLWDPKKILAGASSEECLFSRQKNHSGAIKGLDFNPFQPNLLASGAANGEVFIWNLGDLTKPYTPGPKSSKLEDITCLKWNQKVQHILATSSTSGYTVVWDLKNRREVMSLGSLPTNSNGFGMSGSRGITAVAWNPESATQLVTASEDDHNPIIMLWDLRNANAPEKVFSGHTKGVLSLSWCRQDNDLLLSCGKDNRTICWNPNSGEIVGEFAPSKNWSFDVQFSPRNPNLLSTSSFDNQVCIYSLLSSEGTVTEASTDDDPFTQAITPQTTSFSLKQPPKWFRRPVGASFGFGGQLTSFRLTESGEKRITVATIQIEPEVINRADELANAINSDGILEYCEKKASLAQKDNDKLSWDLMRLLLDKDGRNQINQILEVESKVSDDAINKVLLTLGQASDSPASTKETSDSPAEVAEEKEPAQDEFSNLFQGGEDGEDSKKEEEFFSNSQLHSTSEMALNPSDFKAAATPFAINANPTSLEGVLSQMVVLGDFKGAAELSLKAGHYDDALLFAMCGGKELIERIKQKVFAARRDQFSYLRLLENVMGGNWMDVVLSADLSEWKQIVAVINTYVQGQDLKHLYSALGSRLAQAEDSELRQNALLCFLLASSLEDAVSLWVSELAGANQNEVEVRSQLFSDHIVLQDLIEKVTIFSKVIGSDHQHSGLMDSNSNQSKWNLLYSLYYEYSLFMTSQGRLDVASSYLQMIPSHSSRPSDSSRDDYAALKYQLSYAGVDVGPLDSAYPFDFVEIGGASHLQEPAYGMPSQATYQPTNYGYDGYGTQQAYPANPTQQTYPANPTQPTYPSNPTQQTYPSNPTQQPPQYGGYQTHPFQTTPTPAPLPNFENSALYTQYPNYPPNNSLPAFPSTQHPPQQDAIPPPSAQKGGPAWNDPPAEVFSSQTKSIPKSKPGGAAAITSPFGATGPTPPTSQGYNYGAPPASLPPPPQGGRAPAPLYSRKEVNKPPSNPQRTGFQSHPSQQHPPAGFHPQMPQQPGFTHQPPPQTQPNTQPPTQPTKPQRPLYQTNPAPPSHSLQGNAQRVPQNSHPNGPPGGPPGPGTPRPNYGNARPEMLPRPPQQSAPPKPQPVAIDRSKMPVKYKPLVDLLTKPLNALKASGVPPPQQRMLADVDKRISQLLDSMNQDTLHPSLVDPLTQFGKALEAKDFNQALTIQSTMVSNQVNQVGPWVAGLKHLVSLLRAQPV